MTELTPNPRPLQLRAVAPAVVALGGAVLLACLYLAAAGGDAVRAFSRFAVEGAIVLGWAASAIGLGAGVLHLLRVAPERASLHLATAFGLGTGVMALTQLVLGLVGVIGFTPAWVVLLPGWVIGALLLRGREVPPTGDRAAWAALLPVPLLAAALALALLPPAFLWPGEPNRYDVLAYHLQLPREWMELGRIVPLTHNVFSFFPLAMEMHYLQAMQLVGDPWAGAYPAQLMHTAFFVMATVAAWGAFRPRGVWPATLAAGAIASCPYVLLLAPIAYNEGPLVLFGTLAIAHALLSPTWRSALVAGLCAGFACGAKLTALPLWVVALPIAMLIPPRAESDSTQAHGSLSVGLRSSALRGSILVLGAVLVVSPWLVRTALWSGGNPVFPLLARQLGAGHFTPDQVTRFERAHAPREDQRPPAARVREFARQVATAPEFGYALLPAALLGGLLALRSRLAVALFVLLAAHLGVWLFATHLQGRFFVPSLPVLAALLALTPGVLRYVSGASLLACGVVSLSLAYGRLDFLRDPEGRLLGDLAGRDYRSLEPMLMPEAVVAVPREHTLALVGDARAYLYTRPMSQLRYTSVFDAAGSDVQTAWRLAPGDTLWIDPGELKRFGRTYHAIPALPPQWDRPSPFLVEP